MKPELYEGFWTILELLEAPEAPEGVEGCPWRPLEAPGGPSAVCDFAFFFGVLKFGAIEPRLSGPLVLKLARRGGPGPPRPPQDLWKNQPAPCRASGSRFRVMILSRRTPPSMA